MRTCVATISTEMQYYIDIKLIMTPSNLSACSNTAEKPEDGQRKKGEPLKRN
jgi:hypothetical protein